MDVAPLISPPSRLTTVNHADVAIGGPLAEEEIIATRHLFPFGWSEDEVVAEERHGGCHPHENLAKLDEGGRQENVAGRKVDEINTEVAQDGEENTENGGKRPARMWRLKMTAWFTFGSGG